MKTWQGIQLAFTCTKSTKEALEQCMKFVQNYLSSFFIVNFRQTLHILQAFLLMTLSK